MYKLLTESKGMSFLEALVATAIVSLIIVAILATVTQSVLLTEKADKVYTASLLAQGRLDVLKKFDFDDLPTIASETDVGVDVNDDNVVDYMRTTEITHPYAGNDHLLKVKVSVDRVVDGQKSGNPVAMETVFVDPEVYE
jgi:type II secretory pathway pseudopilin PulG